MIDKYPPPLPTAPPPPPLPPSLEHKNTLASVWTHESKLWINMINIHLPQEPCKQWLLGRPPWTRPKGYCHEGAQLVMTDQYLLLPHLSIPDQHNQITNTNWECKQLGIKQIINTNRFSLFLEIKVHKQQLLINMFLYQPLVINTSDRNQLWCRAILIGHKICQSKQAHELESRQ